MNARVSVSEAARQLQVSRSRVLELVHTGALDGEKVGRQWVLDRTSLAAFEEGHRKAGAPLSQQSAWLALRLLAEGSLPHDVDRHRRARVLAWLRKSSDPVEDFAFWRRLLAKRADLARYRSHPGVVERLRADPRLWLTGADALPELGLTRRPSVDAYVDPAAAEAVVKEYRLTPDSTGNVRLREVRLPRELLLKAQQSAAALDLSDEGDPRSRELGAARLHALWSRTRKSLDV
jgi:excisionase family DNA binding protein